MIEIVSFDNLFIVSNKLIISNRPLILRHIILILFPQQSVLKPLLQHEMRTHPIRNQCQQLFPAISRKVANRRKIVFISIAINRITLKIESKMSNQDAIATYHM